MKTIRAIFRGIVGLVFGLASALALMPDFAAFAGGETGTEPSWTVWLVVLVGFLLGLFAPTIRRAFGRGFLVLGACVFALPISTFLLSGRVANDMMDKASGTTSAEQAATTIGSGIAGTLLTGASVFVGFIVGTILLIIGLVLVLGGRREVVMVRQG